MTWAIIFWCVVFAITTAIGLFISARAMNFGGVDLGFHEVLRNLKWAAAISTTFTLIAIGIVAAFQGIFA